MERKRNLEEEKAFNHMKAIQVYTVEGMTCNHCKATVEKGVRELDATGEIYADPSSNELRISSANIPEEEIRKKVESLGYIFKGRKKN